VTEGNEIEDWKIGRLEDWKISPQRTRRSQRENKEKILLRVLRVLCGEILLKKILHSVLTKIGITWNRLSFESSSFGLLIWKLKTQN